MGAQQDVLGKFRTLGHYDQYEIGSMTVTDQDEVWPNEWVKTSPKCDFQTFKGTTDCTLVANLPDIRTESDEEVELPPYLVEKWKAEGRYEQEVAELTGVFFNQTSIPGGEITGYLKWQNAANAPVNCQPQQD